MFTSSFFEQAKTVPEVLCTPRKFDLALRVAAVNIMKDKVQKLESQGSLDCAILLSHVTPDTVLRASPDPTLWPSILTHVLDESLRGKDFSTHSSDLCTKVIQLISTNIDRQHHHLNASNLSFPHLGSQKFQQWINRVSHTDPVLRNLTHLENEFGVAVEKVMGLAHRLRSRAYRNNLSGIKKDTHYSVPCLNLSLVWSKSVILWTWGDQSWLTPLDYILMVHNKICDALSTLILMQGASGVCYEPTAYDIVVSFIRALCDLARTHAGYFDVVKSLEGLVIAEVLNSEEDWHNVELRDSIVEDLLECGYTYRGGEIEDLLRKASSPLKHEISGLAKLCGHPYIDLPATARHSRDRANIEKDIDYVAIISTRNIALESFIRSYILKEKTWPPVEFDDLTPGYLREACAKNLDPYSQSIVRKYGRGHHDDFIHVTLGKIAELDRLDHYSQYLKDRAISVMRDKAQAYYIDKTLKFIPWEEGRLLLVHLFTSEEQHDLCGYLRDYMGSDASMAHILDYLTIKLIPKEKELKVIGRPFGCKTYQDRYRSCLQEENAKTFLSKYCSDQAMTLDNLSLIKRMHSFRNLRKIYKDWRVLYINFDVSGWCANFRHETVEPVTSDLLDKLYGTRDFFGKTQRAYQNTFFYLPDQEGNYSWTGQDGGVEGLNQYTWMTTYIPQMQLALREYHLQFFVMCYGDDYKAGILIPPDQQNLDLHQLKTQVVNGVSEKVRISFGQKMKVFDSYGSEVYISFCKNASIRGVEMPQGIRKVQKCYGATNAFLPTLDDYFSSAFSNAHAASRSMTCTYPAYRVALFWGYYHLLRHDIWKGRKDVDYHVALLTPSCVGGFPTLMLATFHTRAENDHLPMFIDFILHLRTQDMALSIALEKALVYEVVSEENRFETLLRDPYSLPIKRPPGPASYLRAQIIPAIQSKIQNAEMLALIEASEDDWTNQVIRCLLSGPELHPRVASSVYSCTPKALVEEIIRRFEAASTICKIVVLRRGPKYTIKLMREVLRREITLQEWRLVHLTTEGAGTSPLIRGWCPTRISQHMRLMWGKPVVGVTMPPVTHLITVVDADVGMYDHHAQENHFHYLLERPEDVNRRSPSQHWHMGQQSPFIGHRTRLGAELPSVKVIDTNPFLSKIRTLLDVVSWVLNQPDEEHLAGLQDLVLVLISQYYDGDPTELLPFGAQRKSGTIQHHWRSPHYSEHIMPNTLSNTYTWVRGDCNTHLALRGATTHHTLNFLQVMCHTFHLLQVELEFSPEVTAFGQRWAVTTDCQLCMAPIEEPPIVVLRGLLPAVRRTTLSGLALTRQSRQVLAQSAQELQERGPKVRDDNAAALGLPFAVAGVVHRLGDQGCSRAQRLVDRFSLPSRNTSELDQLALWAPGGDTQLVREREIRGCPIPLLAQSVLDFIEQRILILGARSTIRTRAARALLLNPRDAPWYPMVAFLHKAGVLTDTILEVKDITGIAPPLCYDNPLVAARYMCHALLQSTGYRHPTVFTWLSYYDDDTIQEAAAARAARVRSNLIWRELKPQLWQAQRAGGFDRDDLMDHIQVAMLVAAAMESSAIPEIPPHGLVPLDLLDRLSGTPEDIDLALENQDHIIHDVVEFFQQQGLIMPTEDTIDEYHPDASDTVINILDRWGPLTIQHTTLATCIARVRAEPVVVPAFRGYRADRGQADIGYGIRRLHPQLGFHVNQLQPHQGLQPLVPEVVEIFGINELIVYPHSIARPFGDGTMSNNKILEVFAYLNVIVDTLSGGFIMCLGEGYGGILDCLARLTRGVHFVFNTLPPDVQYGAHPALALRALERGNHTLDDVLTNTSVFDLSIPGVASALCRDIFLYNLITCDAEADWADTGTYARLLMNVCHIYLRKRTLQGLLILKVMIEHQRAVCQIMTLLSHYSEETGILQLTSSPPGGECYVYARGIGRVYTNESKDVPVPNAVMMEPDIARRLDQLCGQLRARWQDLAPPREIQLRIHPAAHGEYLRPLRDRLVPAYWNRMTGRNGVYIHLTEAEQRTPAEIPPAIIRELERLKNRLHDERNQEMTAAGFIQYVSRVLLTRSLLTYMGEVFQLRTRVLLQSTIRRQFLHEIDPFWDRLDLDLVRPQIFEPTVLVLGYPAAFYSMWIEGLEIVLQLFGYTTIR